MQRRNLKSQQHVWGAIARKNTLVFFPPPNGCPGLTAVLDNPKDYADNIDARQYDTRLRGPVDERRELSIDPQTGLKNYIATEGIGIATSAELVRNLFGRSIQLGRQYARSRNKSDLY